jgi:hypothetical protein
MKLTIDYLCDDSQTTLSKHILNGKNKYGRKIFLKMYLLFLKNIQINEKTKNLWVVKNIIFTV